MDWLKTGEGSRLARRVESARRQVLKSHELDHPADYDKRRSHAISDFRDTWLKAVCSQLYYTLPRELRDKVYCYLVHGQRRLMTYSNHRQDNDEPGRLKLIDSPFHKQMAYWDKDVAGVHMFREMVEAWYKCAVFNSDFILNGGMYDYIRRDRWALGIVPATLIKQVTIRLDSYYHIELSTAHHNLRVLGLLRKGTCIRLTLDDLDDDGRCLGCDVATKRLRDVQNHVDIISRTEHSVERILQVWQPLVQPLQKLEDLGMRISVSVRHGERKLVLYRDGHNAMLSEDYCRSVIEAKRKSLLQGATVDGIKLKCLLV